MPAREPDSISHRQRPQDRQLIQHLADEAECHVEIQRKKTCNDKVLFGMIYGAYVYGLLMVFN